MIIFNQTNELILPKVNRCRLDPCNLYQLILQNKATKEFTIFKIRDYSTNNPMYFVCYFDIPEWFEAGEYEMYFVKSNEWVPGQINEDNVYDSVVMTDKTPVAMHGILLMSGDRLLVTKNFKAKLADISNTGVKSRGYEIVSYTDSKDMRATGEIWTYLDVLFTDIVKYKQVENDLNIIEPERNKNKRKYIEHNRR